MKLLLFDIDMTLISTGGAGIRALGEAFEAVLGLPEALHGVRPHGKTDPAIVREACVGQGVAVTPELVDRVLAAYLSFLEGEVRSSSTYRVLPGVVELLERAAGPDVGIGLATGNVEHGARIKLDRGALNRFFGFGGFGSDSEDRAEVVRTAARRGRESTGSEIAREDTFVIGDTPMDVRAGRAAGFRTIAVASGSYRSDELEKAGADYVLPDFQSGRDQFLRSTRIE